MKTIYLCGPRSGPHIVNTNIELFADASIALRSLGHNVLNPVEVNLAFLGRPYSPAVPDSFEEASFINTLPGLRADIIAMLTVCNCIAIMPEWERAVGCRIEVGLAITFGYSFVDWKTAEEIKRPSAVNISHGYHDRPPGFATFGKPK